MTLREHEFTPVFGEIRLAYRLGFLRVLLYLITFFVMCCDVCYDFISLRSLLCVVMSVMILSHYVLCSVL